MPTRRLFGLWLFTVMVFPFVPDAFALPNYVGDISVEVDGGDVSFVFRVENTGNQPAPGLFACYFFDLPGAPVNGVNIQDGCIDLEAGLLPGEDVSVEEVVFKDPGTYSAWMVIDPINLVLESSESDNMVGPASYMVVEEEEVVHLPDLQVVDPKVEVGDKLMVTATVQNIGTASSGGGTFVDLYYSGSEQPDAFTEVPELGAGGEFQLLFSEALPEPGTYVARLNIDPYNEIKESDENNTTPDLIFKVLDLDAVKADLSASEIQVEVLEDQKIQVNFTIKNEGPGESGQFIWSLYLDPELPISPSMESEATVAHESILPGDAAIASLPNPIHISQGEHELWAIIDPNKWVYEENLDNNVIGPIPFTVGGGVGGADLVVEQFSPIVTASRQVLYNVKVSNIGTGASGAFYVDVVFDSTEAPSPEMDPFPGGLAYFEEVGLSPGQSITYLLERELAPVGVYKSWAIVDLFDLVLEKNEENNLFGPVEVEVLEAESSPDLTIELFKAKVEGNRVVYLVDCVNVGAVRSGPFSVGLFRDRAEDDAPQYGDIADDIFKVDELDVDGRVEVGFLWEPAPDGAVQSWLLVDLENTVFESNEANNRAGPRVVFVDSSAEKCLEDEAIESACVCGNETVYQGYCCDNTWSLSSCDEPINQGEQGIGNEAPGLDATGSTDVITLNNGQSGDSAGCQLSRF